MARALVKFTSERDDVARALVMIKSGRDEVARALVKIKSGRAEVARALPVVGFGSGLKLPTCSNWNRIVVSGGVGPVTA